MKIAMGIEYCGARYGGWQKQKTALNVQGHLEKAISQVANQPIEVVCAGRTDRGVHALAQVIHFETTADRDQRSWLLGTNTYLPADISVSWVKSVADNFHARFAAIAREYQYVLCNRMARPGVFHEHVAWHFYDLDVDAMQVGASYLLGEHDFSAFRGADCQAKTTQRHVMQLDVERVDTHIIFTIKANAFLYHMVRNIVGTLLSVGRHEQAPEWMQSVLATKDRRAAGVTAPAAGLYFIQAFYPTNFVLPQIKGDLRQYLRL